MKINEKVLMAGTGCNSATAKKWIGAFNSAMEVWAIKTPNSIAALLANVGVESAGLTKFEENLNYSADGLANTWPNRYAAKDAKGQYIKKNSGTASRPNWRYTPNQQALSLHRKPEKIANATYANRMGNGSVISGDGWKHRGQGPIQITGLANMQDFKKASGVDVVSHPELLHSPEVGALSAAWFFTSRGATKAADKEGFDETVKIVNGAYPSKANHGPQRKALFESALAAIKAMS
ncbi:endolysin [Xanthomonas phage XcP1]|uniref:Lytic enzyme n=1 Tax=Xanthomonas phage XcP1 TaxID=2785027 RepID=A0A3S7L8K0_9CAUD|nr:endolysin [Xanthomonas phage XcP1]AWN08534.1 lytic enzyme [Xanthomonas phage XcP1]